MYDSTEVNKITSQNGNEKQKQQIISSKQICVFYNREEIDTCELK